MSAILTTLPCTARELESALHAVCDHHGLWNGRIDTMCNGSDSGDACVSIVLSEGSGETSPSPSAPTSPAPANSAALREALEALNRIDTRGLKRLLCELVESDIFDGGQINKTISAVDKAKAALDKPLRNCDRFGGDYKMLYTAWFDWTGSPSGQNPDGTVKLTFAEWLLAPATEGGAK